MNKGINAATGDVVAILNADDVYASTDVFAKVTTPSAALDVEAVYGDLHYVAADDLTQVTRRWQAGTYTPGAFRRGWMPPHHPTLFVRRACYDRWGFHHGPSLGGRLRAHASVHSPTRDDARLPARDPCADACRWGQQRLLNHRILAHREDWKAWRMNGYHPAPFTLLAKPLRKLPNSCPALDAVRPGRAIFEHILSTT